MVAVAIISSMCLAVNGSERIQPDLAMEYKRELLQGRSKLGFALLHEHVERTSQACKSMSKNKPGLQEHVKEQARLARACQRTSLLKESLQQGHHGPYSIPGGALSVRSRPETSCPDRPKSTKDWKMELRVSH
jgi:hypothetical protein